LPEKRREGADERCEREKPYPHINQLFGLGTQTACMKVTNENGRRLLQYVLLSQTDPSQNLALLRRHSIRNQTNHCLTDVIDMGAWNPGN
jgi:hypothetical protein